MARGDGTPAGQWGDNEFDHRGDDLVFERTVDEVYEDAARQGFHEEGGFAAEHVFEVGLDYETALQFADEVRQGDHDTYLGDHWVEIYLRERDDGTYNVVVDYISGVET